MSDRKYLFNYMLMSDEKSLGTVISIANPAFDEVGEYTIEECHLLHDFIQTRKVPEKIKGVYAWAVPHVPWEPFRLETNALMKQLIEDERKKQHDSAL